MGSFNNPVVLQPYKSAWESTILPTMTSVLGNLALAKIQHNWDMDIADKKIAASSAAAQAQRDFQSSQTDKKIKSEESIASKNRQTRLMTSAMGLAGKPKPTPYAPVVVDGQFYGVLNKSDGSMDTAGVDSSGVPSKFLQYWSKTDEDGNVTFGVKDKRTGKDMWTDTKEGIGRPGKTAEPPSAKIDLAGKKREATEAAAAEAYKKSPRAYDDALKTVQSKAEENPTLWSNYQKDQNTFNQDVAKEHAERVGLKEKYPGAILWNENGEFKWVVQEGQRYRIVLDKSGLK